MDFKKEYVMIFSDKVKAIHQNFKALGVNLSDWPLWRLYGTMASVYQRIIDRITTDCLINTIFSWGEDKKNVLLQRYRSLIRVIMIKKARSLGIFINLVIFRDGKWQAWSKLGMERWSLFTATCCLTCYFVGKKDTVDFYKKSPKRWPKSLMFLSVHLFSDFLLQKMGWFNIILLFMWGSGLLK